MGIIGCVVEMHERLGGKPRCCVAVDCPYTLSGHPMLLQTTRDCFSCNAKYSLFLSRRHLSSKASRIAASVLDLEPPGDLQREPLPSLARSCPLLEEGAA